MSLEGAQLGNGVKAIYADSCCRFGNLVPSRSAILGKEAKAAAWSCQLGQCE